MMSNKSKSDLFESLQRIPSQDPMLTKSDRRCLFTRLNSNARLWNTPQFGRNTIQGFKLLLRKLIFLTTSF